MTTIDCWDLHDIVVVGSYELRIREDGIGSIVIEAWREVTTGGERELFEKVQCDVCEIDQALKELWEKLCG